jgi:class 3 adenylate cyclase/tetratricopeptide (TPR) repeat protein
MSVCPQCGTENSAGRKFCGGCGASLALACPACGAGNEPGMRFCGECGSALDAAGPAMAAAMQPTSERRLVSVLFADLVGFTTLSESRDAEDVRELLSGYFDTCRRLVSLYGGTVEKFIGDAVMAVWGTPTATEDDAERAVRAALDLVTAVAALGEEFGTAELYARVGVLTGEAAVTLGAEGEGMVAGDLVNTASRIQAVAHPGTVLVGDSTRRATEAAIAYEDAGSHELKGKAEPVSLWRALRVVSGRQGALKSSGLEAPFVGRDRELRQLKDLFHACADERKPHLVSVTGIAGIGKSRLAWEFYKYFDGLAETVYWHRGRCLSYGEGVTYWALADMIRMRCLIAEDEAAESARTKLRSTLEEHLLDAEERQFVEPRLAQLLGLGDSKTGDKQDLFGAWRLFFERLAQTYPTVLVFEDVQWADASLLDFIEYLLEWSRGHAIFVLTLARPELAERRPAWGAGQRHFSSLYLEPLSESAMDELLTGLVPGLPPELRSRILERAEGVPLYAVETVRMLLDRGLLVQDGTVYRPVGEIESLDVPETLHALIASRLDGVSAEERRLLQDASVLGKTFTRDGLEALAGGAAVELDALLSSLVRKEVLGLQADPRSPEHGQYGFLQDLVRHVAYEMLSRRERRAKHLAAAQFLEGAFADESEFVEVIASHYVQAHAAAPEADDAEAVKTKARDALARAGERAESLGATGEAARYLEDAAGLTEAHRERAELLFRAGWLATIAADYETAERLLDESVALYEAAGDRREAANVSSRRAIVDRWQGRHDEALARAEAAFEVLAGGEEDEPLARVAGTLASIYVFGGDLPRARESIELALRLGESLVVPEVLAWGFNTRSIIASSEGRLQEAIAFLKQGLAIALEHNLPEPAGTAYFSLSDRSFARDRYVDALTYLEEALALGRRRGSRAAEWSVLAELTYPLYMLGRWDEAVAAFAELPEDRLRDAVTLSSMTSVLEIHLHRGDPAEARRLLGLYAELEETKDVQDRSVYLSASAAIRRAEGGLDDALSLGVQAAELSQATFGAATQAVKQGLVEALEAALALGHGERVEELLASVEGVPPGLRSPYLQAQAMRFRARLAGADEAAASGFSTAAGYFRELEIPFWTAVTRLEHAEWLAARDRAAEAEPLLVEAIEGFGRLRATPWLARAASLRGEAREEAVA